MLVIVKEDDATARCSLDSLTEVETGPIMGQRAGQIGRICRLGWRIDGPGRGREIAGTHGAAPLRERGAVPEGGA